MSMNEAERKLVEELRSGKRKQGAGHLRPTATTWCCLGVACEVLVEGAEWHKSPDADYISFVANGRISHNWLPDVVKNQLEWESPMGTLDFKDRENGELSLAGLNDGGTTFYQISDLIEAGLVRKANQED